MPRIRPKGKLTPSRKRMPLSQLRKRLRTLERRRMMINSQKNSRRLMRRLRRRLRKLSKLNARGSRKRRLMQLPLKQLQNQLQKRLLKLSVRGSRRRRLMKLLLIKLKMLFRSKPIRLKNLQKKLQQLLPEELTASNYPMMTKKIPMPTGTQRKCMMLLRPRRSLKPSSLLMPLNKRKSKKLLLLSPRRSLKPSFLLRLTLLKPSKLRLMLMLRPLNKRKSKKMLTLLIQKSSRFKQKLKHQLP